MEDQTIVTLANTIGTIINGHLSSSATLEAANKAFNAAIISAGASILVGLFSACFSYYQSKKMIRKDYNKMYKDIVTSERIKWLNNLREVMVEFIATAQEVLIIKTNYLNSQNNDFVGDNKDIIFKFNKTIYAIQLRLNPDNLDEIAFLKKLEFFHDDVVNSYKVDDIAFIDTHSKMDEIALLCQQFIKIEWEHIKKEAEDINMKSISFKK